MRYVGTIMRLTVMLSAMILMAQLKILAVTCPCDIYKDAGTPCVAAYSTVRLLNSTYTGPLYQVRKSSDQSTKDIYTLPGLPIVNAGAQDSFLGSGAGTISKLYDQSGKGNDLIKAPGGSANPNPDKESDAKGKSFNIAGHKAYALYMGKGEGYRNNKTTGVPTGSAPQGIYAVEDGSRMNGNEQVGCCCCFDFGNAETNNQADGTGSMNSLFFGTAYWAKGAGNGPWFENDMEAGVWGGGYKDPDPGDGSMGGKHNPNPLLLASKFDFAFGLTKTNTLNGTPQYSLRVANGSASTNSANLVTAYSGRAPSTWKMGGAILLGIGGDNSNSSTGTFYEGAFTSGRPSDTTDSLILKNVQDAKYGSSIVMVPRTTNDVAAQAYQYNVHFNPACSKAIISYTMQDARSINMNILDQQGRQVAVIVNGIMAAGRHEVVWDAKRVPAGVYICRTAIDGLEGWSEKIIIGK